MLEARADQGESLRRSTPQAALRLISLVSQGDAASEQPLLWQLCSALRAFGYPLVVLDGTSLESEQHPGLRDLLEDTHWARLGAAEVADWPVMPAAAGLRALVRRPAAAGLPLAAATPPLQTLGDLFHDYSVVVVYARAELLIPVLAGSKAQPLLSVTPRRSSVLGSYRTFKQLLQKGRLVPTLASLVNTPVQGAEVGARSAGKTLQKCAMTHLGCNTDMMTVRSDDLPGRRSDDAHRLALRLLENATSLGRSPWRAATPDRGRPAAAIQVS